MTCVDNDKSDGNELMMWPMGGSAWVEANDRWKQMMMDGIMML